jgi:hypothetical protein
MHNPWKFLEAWAKENVQAAAFDADPVASNLAERCLRDARRAGIKEDAVIKAAKGDLSGFFRAELESAANAEVARLVQKDKR